MKNETPRTQEVINSIADNPRNVQPLFDHARMLERELIASKRSNERITYDYNMLARDTRYAEAMQRAAERDAIAAIDREKRLEEQRNTLNETCHALRMEVGDLRAAVEWCLDKTPSPCRCMDFGTPPHVCVAHKALISSPNKADSTTCST